MNPENRVLLSDDIDQYINIIGKPANGLSILDPSSEIWYCWDILVQADFIFGFFWGFWVYIKWIIITPRPTTELILTKKLAICRPWLRKIEEVRNTVGKFRKVNNILNLRLRNIMAIHIRTKLRTTWSWGEQVKCHLYKNKRCKDHTFVVWIVKILKDLLLILWLVRLLRIRWKLSNNCKEGKISKGNKHRRKNFTNMSKNKKERNILRIIIDKLCRKEHRSQINLVLRKASTLNLN